MIAITKLLMFALILFVAATRGGIFKSKIADLEMLVECLKAQMSDHVAHSTNALSLFMINYTTAFGRVLARVAFCRGQEVHWSHIHLRDHFSLTFGVQVMLLVCWKTVCTSVVWRIGTILCNPNVSFHQLLVFSRLRVV